MFNGQPHALPRVLGPISAMSVVIGAIIGVGIFFQPSRVARTAGSADMALLAWTVGGVIAMCGALTFAALGARYPNAGGQYEILRDAYGPLPAFLFVFCNATAVQTGAIAIIALICAQNLAIAFAGGELPSRFAVVAAAALIGGVTLANAWGVRWGAGIQNLTVAAKLATLAAVTLVAAAFAPAAAGPAAVIAAVGGGAAVSSSPLVLLFAAIVPSFFAYGGWQHALWIAGEVREPRRNLPLAIIGGVLIVVVAYLLVNWAYLRLLGYDAVTRSGALAADAIARVWPQSGRRVTAAAVAMSAFGVLNAQLLSGPRLVYRMALDGRFFGSFAHVSERRGTPLPAVLLLGGLGLSLLLLAAAFSTSAFHAIDRLTTGVVFIDGVFFALTGMAIFVLNRRGTMDRMRLGYPWIPAVFIAGEIGIIFGAYADASTRSAAVIGVGWIFAALLVFVLFFRRERRM